MSTTEQPTTDRDRLELAAKAVGYIDDAKDASDANGLHRDVGGLFYIVGPDGWQPWNPRDDDGDSFRLAVQMGMLFTYTHERFEMFQRFYREELDKDHKPSEATRYAIVRVAAEVGRAMP